MSGRCSLVATAGWAAVCGPAAGQCQYEVVEPLIQAPSCGVGGPPATTPTGMNSHGHVVGYYAHCSISGHAFGFIWKPGTGMVTLPMVDGMVELRPADINDAGVIVGTFRIPGMGYRGFVWDPATQEYTYLEPLHDGVVAHTVSSISAVNNAGVAVGSRVISEPGEPVVSNAVIWHPFGIDGEGPEVVIDLGDFGVGPNSSAYRISESGQSVLGITGPQNNPIGFVYEPPSRPFVVGESFGMSSSTVFGVISDGHYAGTGAFIDTGLVRAFVLNEAKITAMIDPLPGYSHSATRDANVLGQVLVRSQVPGDKPGIWQNGVHTSLDDLVEPVPGLVLTLPRSINDAGQIITRATLGSKTVGVLLTPFDRPLTDLNGDCVTDVYDLLILLGSWGPCDPDHCPADFTGSGSVGVPDLLILLSNWG